MRIAHAMADARMCADYQTAMRKHKLTSKDVRSLKYIVKQMERALKATPTATNTKSANVNYDPQYKFLDEHGAGKYPMRPPDKPYSTRAHGARDAMHERKSKRK